MAQKTKTELRKTDFLVIRSQRNDDILKIVTPQNYQIGLDDVSQVKFYQGMLKQKGTKSAVDKLVRSKFDTISSDVQFYEEWAIRTGSYGANTINNRVELELDEAGFTDNPQILKTVKSVEEKTLGSKTEYTVEDFYKKPADVNYDFIPTQKSLQFGHTSEQFHNKLLHPILNLLQVQ